MILITSTPHASTLTLDRDAVLPILAALAAAPEGSWKELAAPLGAQLAAALLGPGGHAAHLDPCSGKPYDDLDLCLYTESSRIGRGQVRRWRSRVAYLAWLLHNPNPNVGHKWSQSHDQVIAVELEEQIRTGGTCDGKKEGAGWLLGQDDLYHGDLTLPDGAPLPDGSRNYKCRLWAFVYRPRSDYGVCRVFRPSEEHRRCSEGRASL